jgi:hypothetical protein
MTTTPRLWKSLTQVNTTDGGAAQFGGQIVGLHDGGYFVACSPIRSEPAGVSFRQLISKRAS